MMRVLDVFSCIGFHSIGLRRAGDFEIVALCESNERRRQELASIHPETPIYDDIRRLPQLMAEVIFGGPPCQETSVASAIHGRRSGNSLWPYMLCAGLNAGVEWFVVEQPPGHSAWEAQVSHHLSRAGYHVARFVFGAEDVGAPYPRRRVYLIACTSLPRLEVAWKAGPSAIERVKRAADARGDWHPDTVPAFDLATWRTEDVHERRERIEALGDSNPPAMAEVIGHMLLASSTPPPPDRSCAMNNDKKLTEAQRRALEVLGAGRVEYSTWGGGLVTRLPAGIKNRGTLWALERAGLARTWRNMSTTCWGLTDLGRSTLSQESSADHMGRSHRLSPKQIEAEAEQFEAREENR